LAWSTSHLWVMTNHLQKYSVIKMQYDTKTDPPPLIFQKSHGPGVSTTVHPWSYVSYSSRNQWYRKHLKTLCLIYFSRQCLNWRLNRNYIDGNLIKDHSMSSKTFIRTRDLKFIWIWVCLSKFIK
jgi:hypothetical protein